MARKKSRKKVHRKNPKRVAAGKRAARARWGGHKKKSTRGRKKARRKLAGPVTKILRTPKLLESLLKRISGPTKHKGHRTRGKRAPKTLQVIQFPGDDRPTLISPMSFSDEPKTVRYHRKRKASAAQLRNLARGRAIRNFNLAQRG